ncbi:MAG: hypothetical protein HND44_13765 [Chloroflexi bacterium]|nr:hypothetical protein [Ardenticatenaceae bacterium]MBL1129541.1 hypothetical protein [Chloroflexota bacterium]NOG35623.1 hypothetical protein [Chloroflexota bacterium]GIK58492.1 MAG: hypothetical protein BroJett015_41550 [Chloroflexota bacterium]
MNQAQPPKPVKPQINNNLPNPVMLARQIDGIREVVLRMRTTPTTAVDSLIQQKLQTIIEH